MNISVGTIYNVLSDFRNKANASKEAQHRPPLQYPTRQLSEETKYEVYLRTEENNIENKSTSTRKVANEMGISQSSVYRILKERRYKPYKMEKHQELVRDDPMRRMVHCELMTEEIAINARLPYNIWFTDECEVVLKQGPNRQQIRYWRTNAPEEVYEVSTQYQQKLNVWAAIYDSQIIGPFFFENNITGAAYLQMLNDQIIPAIRDIE